jgi:hypothetical protein
MPVPTAPHRAYRGDETPPGGAIRAQPDHAPVPPAPAATAQLLDDDPALTAAGSSRSACSA